VIHLEDKCEQNGSPIIDSLTYLIVDLRNLEDKVSDQVKSFEDILSELVL